MQLTTRPLVIGVLVALLGSSVDSKRCPKGPTVTAAAGAIQGIATQVPNSDVTVNKFLGIPFAEPPVRFGAPKALSKPFNSTFKATKLPPSCLPQISANGTAFSLTPEPPESNEDCLYLNVYTPATKAPRGGRAVMYWLYGGNLQFGWSGTPAYDGSPLAAMEDVVVVTVNYRTNVFGFPNAPELPKGEQNPGFLDQRLGLSWVQQNIAAFGGDPKKVAIFGESAGGYSVKQLLAQPPDPLPFRAAIMESEAAGFQNGSQSWTRISRNLGCTGDTTLECMRKVPVTQLTAALSTGIGLSFGPVADDTTQSADVTNQINARTFADVPIIIGTNAEEGGAFDPLNTDPSLYLATVFPGNASAAQAAADAYPAGSRNTAAVMTDFTFQCPAARIAQLTSDIGRPVWRYYFTYPEGRAIHGIEIRYVFGTYDRTGATPYQAELSRYMMGAWASFAKDPSKGPGWVQVGSTSEDVAVLGSNGTSAPVMRAPAELDTRCSVFADALARTGI
ncbi:hypothetical protein LTS18_002971 [Coniosporium uncinatum]|uniref:Uncharacterized protein n=1 Tax=Coniosporium uncinatum TaxID=93489 RepID=A0ACC3D7D1_9PEZI|nr:hypothetical protein LTS18_002971 [Coniosporium uncinatum]